MSNKYTANKQGRSHGAYARRLQDRGLSKAPVMPTLTHLRKLHGVKGGEPIPNGR